jgi:hypothetical protein
MRKYMGYNELDIFHDKTMDGLLFCRKVYMLFNKIRRKPNGIEHLRMRESSVEKKLIEEILPISRYIKAKYCEGRIIKVKWINGNQQYDAIIKQKGGIVDNMHLHKECFIEATCAVHKNDYLLREKINNGGPVFGVGGLKREKKTGNILSVPIVREHPKFISDFAKIIVNRIRDKNEKPYPKNTILVVDCHLDTCYLDDEWHILINTVKNETGSSNFIELFLYDSIMGHCTTFYPAK